MLESLLKFSLVVFFLSEDQSAESIFLALLPVTNIANTVLVKLPSLTVLHSLHELSHVNRRFLGTVVHLQDPCPTALPISKLSLVYKLTGLPLDPLASLFTLTIHELPPAAEVDPALIVEKDIVIGIDAKISTVFIFLDFQDCLVVVYTAHTHQIKQFLSHLHKFFLGGVVGGQPTNLGHHWHQSTCLLERTHSLVRCLPHWSPDILFSVPAIHHEFLLTSVEFQHAQRFLLFSLRCICRAFDLHAATDESSWLMRWRRWGRMLFVL